MSTQEDAAPRRPARGGTAAERHRARTERIIEATRTLFDERGVRDAQIEDIARAVGINRAIIYRHFSGKEELFALTLVSYLDELAEAMRAADEPGGRPTERLRSIANAFLEYGERYPAFVDCAQALLRRPGEELMREVSEPALVGLGRAITACLGQLVTVLEAGNAEGQFAVENPDLLANVLYAQGLGGLQLARLRLSLRESTPGRPEAAPIGFADVKEYLVDAAVAMASGAGSRV